MVIHPYLPNSPEKLKRRMLESLGIRDSEELFSDIPKHLLLKRELDLPTGLSEVELSREVEAMLSKNKIYPSMPCFLGGGVAPHYVPAAVDEIVRRSEFYTAYTPYQPEVSQGMLQALFEYQSLICDLTKMGVANSSLYDWASALGEAGRMAHRITGRKRILVSEAAGPQRLEVMRTYCSPLGMELVKIPYDRDEGCTNLEALREEMRRNEGDVAAIYLEQPNFFGVIEEGVEEAVALAHEKGALAIIGVDPISLGVLKPPGDYGADIVVGDGQPLGLHLNYGGPTIGIFAIREERNLLRQMPGRLIGMTTTLNGNKRAYAMVLQTREQHIRREAATSNICTNQALMAVAVAAYLALMGPHGMRAVGLEILSKSHRAADMLGRLRGVECPAFKGSFFKEFTLKVQGWDGEELHKALMEKGILAAYPLKRHYPELVSTTLFCVTEVHGDDELKRLQDAMKEVMGGG